MFDVKTIRADFPNLNVLIKGKPLVYLDNAATTLKPRRVIEAVGEYYSSYTSNVHRGMHSLSERATTAFEEARGKVRRFLNAGSDEEIIFTGGTTDSINLVAQAYGRAFCHAGDEILISAMEHHSNIVPWQMLCEEKGCRLKIIPMNDKGELLTGGLDRLISERTRLVAVNHISNSLGTVNPIELIIRRAREKSVPVLIDAAQSVGHRKIDVRKLDCDFLALSGHKLFGPTGVGVLYGKKILLEAMPPYRGGGDMIETVTFEKTTYNILPHKFEAGTPNIAGVIGLGAAVDYVESIDLESAARYKAGLLARVTEKLSRIPGLRIIGTAGCKASVVSFVIDGVNAHDLGTLLDEEGVAVRAGHHCTMPVMAHFGVSATTRVSLSIYNTAEEVDHLARSIEKILPLLR
jgi:cysteine desulfurase/selenocysteine lyase